MAVLIANQVKTNMCLVSLYCSQSLCTACTTYTTIFKTITIRSLFLSPYNLFASHTCTLFCTQLRSSNMQLHTNLIELQLVAARFVWPFYIHTPCSWSHILAKASVCAFSSLSVPHFCGYWFIWKAFDVFVYCVQANSCCVCLHSLMIFVFF